MSEQGTEEWLLERLGKVTASRIADVMAKTRTGYGASRANYMAQLICEQLTGSPTESFTNAAMQWGTDTEPFARTAYELIYDLEVVEVGSLDHPDIPGTSASPDGLVGDDGLVEIKCPNTATHLDVLLRERKAIKKQYILQMQWQMAVTNRQWCDFASYDPRLPEPYSLWVTRIERDQEQIDEIESEVKKFLKEMNDKIELLKRKYGN